jgi:hypothetical protein
MNPAFRLAAPEECRCLCGGVISPGRRCNFIIATWSSSYKDSHYAGILDNDTYAPAMHRQIPRVLARPGAVAMLAFERDDPDFLYGHAVAELDAHETPIVHYVFVKGPYRKLGVARGLFEALGINLKNYLVYTCKTGVVRVLLDADKIPRGRFDPNGIRYSKENRRRAL